MRPAPLHVNSSGAGHQRKGRTTWVRDPRPTHRAVGAALGKAFHRGTPGSARLPFAILPDDPPPLEAERRTPGLRTSISIRDIPEMERASAIARHLRPRAALPGGARRQAERGGVIRPWPMVSRGPSLASRTTTLTWKLLPGLRGSAFGRPPQKLHGTSEPIGGREQWRKRPMDGPSRATSIAKASASTKRHGRPGPGTRGQESTRARGGWFCDEGEAVAAGWRAPRW
jgi:hypothetical protein